MKSMKINCNACAFHFALEGEYGPNHYCCKGELKNINPMLQEKDMHTSGWIVARNLAKVAAMIEERECEGARHQTMDLNEMSCEEVIAYLYRHFGHDFGHTMYTHFNKVCSTREG